MFLASLSKGFWVSLVARLVKNPPARRETWVQSLGWEDCSGERKDYLSTPVFWSGEFHGLSSMESQRVGHCPVEGKILYIPNQLSFFHF